MRAAYMFITHLHISLHCTKSRLETKAQGNSEIAY